MDRSRHDEPATECPMLAKQYPYYLANKAAQPNTALDVLDK
jgi:hypothetical protein